MFRKTLTLSNGKKVTSKPSYLPIYVLLTVIFMVIAAEVTHFSFSTLILRSKQFFVIISDMIPPNWSYVNRVFGPLLETIKMSLLGSIIGSLLAIPFAVLCANNIVKNKYIAGFFKFVLSILRTLPTLVVALIATFILGLGAFAGTIAIFMFTISYVGKIMYEQIETIDMRTFEAMESLGLTKLQAFRFSVLPEILPNYLSTAIFCFEGNVRYASILGYVGAGGLGLLLNERLGWRDYSSVGAILLLLIITVALIEMLSEYLRKKLK